MIVNIGAGTTEAAVISAGGIISAKSVKMAGERFDTTLINYLRSNGELLVGDATAEELKIRVGAALSGIRRESARAYGRHARTGMGASLTVTSDDVFRADYSAVCNAMTNDGTLTDDTLVVAADTLVYCEEIGRASCRERV